MPANRDPYSIYPANGLDMMTDERTRKRQRSNWTNLSQSDMSSHDTAFSGGSLDSIQPNSLFANLAAEAQQMWESGKDFSRYVPAYSSICSSASTVSSASFSSAPSISSSATYGMASSFDPTFYCVGQTAPQEHGHFQSATDASSTRWVGGCPWGWDAPSEKLEEFSVGHGNPSRY